MNDVAIAATAPSSNTDTPINSDERLSLFYREVPYNLELEQALLGAILGNNELLNVVSHRLRPEMFYAELHQQIYQTILQFHDKGLVANPVTLKHHFIGEEGIDDTYLAKLAAAAMSVINAADYGQLIIDLAMKRQLIAIGEEVVNEAYDPKDDRSAIQQIEQAEQKLFSLASEDVSERGFRPIKIGLLSAIESAEAAYQRDSSIVGLSSGLRDIDEKLGGLKPSDLLILAGRPSMGKTALATCLAYNVARDVAREHEKNGGTGACPSVGFFSLEMSAEQLAMRILASSCGVNSSKLQRGEITQDEFTEVVRRSNELSALPFHIDDTPALSIAAIRTRARRLKRVHNVGLIIVDYLQLVRGTSQQSQSNRVIEISEITQGLKAIAKELNIPVIALSQLSRAVEQREDKRPQLSDLRESGSIEQDADVVMFVYREEYYLSRTEPRPDTPEHITWMEKMEKVHGLADVIFAKQRHGPIGTVQVQFQSALTRFEDLARDAYLPEMHE